MEDEVRRELVDIVEGDYARTTEFIARLLNLRTGSTGLAITLWIAAIGFGYSSKQAEAFWAASCAVLVIAALDLTYAVHQKALTANSRRYEQALDANYTFLRRQRRTERAIAALWRQFDSVDIGQSTALAKVSPRKLWKAKDGRFFLLLFLALASFALSFGVEAPSPDPICIKSGQAVLEIDAASVERPDALEVVSCP